MVEERRGRMEPARGMSSVPVQRLQSSSQVSCLLFGRCPRDLRYQERKALGTNVLLQDIP